MDRTFKFESSKFAEPLEVYIEVSCTDHDGCDWCLEEMRIFNGQDEVPWDQLDNAEFALLEKKAERIAEELAPEAYQEYIESAGDAAYDAWKDRQIEDQE